MHEADVSSFSLEGQSPKPIELICILPILVRNRHTAAHHLVGEEKAVRVRRSSQELEAGGDRKSLPGRMTGVQIAGCDSIVAKSRRVGDWNIEEKRKPGVHDRCVQEPSRDDLVRPSAIQLCTPSG